MDVRIALAPQYEFLRGYIQEIPISFNLMGNVIHDSRNVIRVDTQHNIKLVIKSYQHIYLFNRFCYATLRPSKAKRAFIHAKRLIDNGFMTPEPIAYIECIEGYQLRDSYFICAYTDYHQLQDMFGLPATEQQHILNRLAGFTYRLHQRNIYHKDYSVSNILYKKNGDEYDFELVDNNRIKFSRESFDYRMKNLRRLDLPLSLLSFFCLQYAEVSGENDLLALATLLSYRKNRLINVYRKTKMKQLLRQLPVLSGPAKLRPNEM
ncbi:lipopolysaccharide kinase InaA family protein [Chitinophaga sp. 30R24]|uniref:lipopolysaccharide kinase InaA family protein n=1 Tax=Chitinophaga sp. 30R24 TaxID=3248838 RepID=UPI003B8EDB27